MHGQPYIKIIARLVQAVLGFLRVIVLDVSVLGCVMHGLAGSN